MFFTCNSIVSWFRVSSTGSISVRSQAKSRPNSRENWNELRNDTAVNRKNTESVLSCSFYDDKYWKWVKSLLLITVDLHILTRVHCSLLELWDLLHQCRDVVVQASVSDQQEATEPPVPRMSSLQAVFTGHIKASLASESHRGNVSCCVGQ